MYNSWTYTLLTRILQLSESMVDAVQEPPGGDFRGDELIRSDATDQGHTAADFPCLASHVELHSSDDCLNNGVRCLTLTMGTTMFYCLFRQHWLPLLVRSRRLFDLRTLQSIIRHLTEKKEATVSFLKTNVKRHGRENFTWNSTAPATYYLLRDILFFFS